MNACHITDKCLFQEATEDKQMNDTIVLSVIITIYNKEMFLRRCLNSVLTQASDRIEFILVDDGSQDNSLSICYEYAEKDQRIIVIHKENEGLVEARKTGLAKAVGSYVTYIDADDWIEPNSYSNILRIISEYSPTFISSSFYKDCNSISVYRDDLPDEGLYSQDALREIIKTSITDFPFYCQVVSPSLCLKVVERSFLEYFQNRIPREIRMGEDMAVSLPMLCSAKSVYFSKKAYYHYCQNDNSMCWTKRTDTYSEYLLLCDYLAGQFATSDTMMFRFFVYSLYFELIDIMTDIPSNYFENGIPFLPIIEKGKRVVIYGKGLFAHNLMEIIRKYNLAEIVTNVDSGDSVNLFSLNSSDYDIVFIAIVDCKVTSSVKRCLVENGVDSKKICVVDKSFLKYSFLPN